MALDRLTKVDGGGISTTSDYRVGIITASKFVGPFDGTGGNFSGVVTATSANFTGNVTIGGTLTYEDVTNIDSVGIITARNGIDCNGDIDVDGHTNLDNVSVAGVTTFASSIHVADSIIHQGDTDTKIEFATNDIRITAANKLRIHHASNGLNYFNGNNISQATSTHTKLAGSDYVHRFRDEEGDDTLVQFFNTNVKNSVFEWNAFGNSTTAGNLIFRDLNTGKTEYARFTGTGSFNIAKDLDVDGHTNLDNVSIAGVTTHNEDVWFKGATSNRDAYWDKSANTLYFKDNARIYLGDSSDFRIYHTPNSGAYGGANFLGANGHPIYLMTSMNGSGENGIIINPNADVILYYDNAVKLRTSQKGITVGTGVTIETNGQATFSGITTGTIFKVPDATNVNGATNHIAIGDNSDLKLYHDNNGDAQIFNSTGHLTIVNNTSGKVINLQPKSGANGVIARYEGAVELYHNGTKKFETTSNGAAVYNIPNNEGLYLNGVGNNTCIKFLSTGSSPGHAFRIAYHSLTGYLYGSPALTFDKTDTSGNFDSHIAGISDGGFHLADNKKLHLGDKMSASGDLQIYHDGTNSFIKNTTGNLRIQDSNGNIQIQAKTGEESIIAKSDGAVELYFNNTKRIETTNTGAIVTGEVAASQDYPDFKPALDLNFSLTKKLDPRITFTRNSVASFVDENGDLKYSTNAPRFNHDPITKECKGLLMEKSKANLLLYSNQMNGGFNRTLENNTTDVVAPDGTNTAVKMILTSTAYGYAFPWNNNTTDSNRTGRRLSYWIKKGDYDQINLTNGNHLIFTFSTKSLTTSGTYTFREKVEEYPNDWYRVSYTIPEGSSNQTLIGKFQGSTNGVVAYFWGFQLEEDGYETSYIPTNGASVTRAVDSAVIDGEDFDEFFSFNGAEFNDYRGTLISFSESDYYANLTAARWNKVQLEQNNDNKVQLCIVGASSPYYDSHITYGTGTQADFTGSQGSTFPTVIKHGVAFAKNNAAYSYNGNTVETDNSVNVGGLPTATHGKYTQLTIGGQPSKAHIKRVMYYSQRISDTQLRNLTS